MLAENAEQWTAVTWVLMLSELTRTLVPWAAGLFHTAQASESACADQPAETFPNVFLVHWL